MDGLMDGLRLQDHSINLEHFVVRKYYYRHLTPGRVPLGILLSSQTTIDGRQQAFTLTEEYVSYQK